MLILRTLVIVVVVVAVGFLILGYLGGFNAGGSLTRERPTSQNSDTVDRARARGAEIGEKAAVLGERAEEVLDGAVLTSKIKAKMALDDSVEAAAIDVTTRGTTVTLSGTVGSTAERDRAMALARETEGVTQVVDDLRVR